MHAKMVKSCINLLNNIKGEEKLSLILLSQDWFNLTKVYMEDFW
jgi:hypothetical protein